MNKRKHKRRLYQRLRKTRFAVMVIDKCARCGLAEPHWVSTEDTFLPYREGGAKGFWTCPDLYDKTTGRRKEPQHARLFF